MRPRVATPYGLYESLLWFVRFALGPSKRNPLGMSHGPKRASLADIEPRLELSFLGDIMGMKSKRLRIGDRMREFLAGSDRIVVNLEGIIHSASDFVFMYQYNPEHLLEDLSLLGPSRVLISLGNNHAGDYGDSALDACRKKVREAGFETVGLKDCPVFFPVPEVALVAGTQWSNQACSEVVLLDGLKPPAQAQVRILLAHWGHEFELYPRRELHALATDLASRWDAIVGTHPHVPQPVAIVGSTPIAFSLGNLAVHYPHWNLNTGIAFRLRIGPDKVTGKWRIGEVAWEFLEVDARDEKDVRVELVDNLRFLEENAS